MVEMLLRASIGSFLASVGFGVLFNIRGNNLFFAGLCGAIGSTVYKTAAFYGMNEVLSNFLGAVAFSIAAEFMARQLKTSVITFTAPALIPLVPGGTAYQMMAQFIQSNVVSGLQLMVQALSVSGVLALGIMATATATRLVMSLRRRFEARRENRMYGRN